MTTTLATMELTGPSGAPSTKYADWRIPSLDGIRAVSILLVLLGHGAMTGGAPRFLTHFGHIGNMGVRCFFVLSGFLITMLLLKELSATGTISLAKFYTRRALRVLPASLAFVGIMATLHQLGAIRLWPGDVSHALTYTANYHLRRSWWLDHLWSLSVEEQFYILWPGIVFLLGARRAFRTAWIVVIAAPVVRAIMWYGLAVDPELRGEYVTQEFQAVVDALAAGCLLAGYFNYLSANSLYLRLQRSAWFLPLVLLGTLGANAVFLVHKAAFYIAGQSIANLGIVLCIDFCIRRSETIGGRVLNCRLALWMGTLSYSLYLWQNPFLNRDLVSPLTSYPVNFVLAFCAASFSYYLVERPFLRLKNRRTCAIAPRPSFF
jgi:peptidoglycan/LPS O-acetylase OafA/YrhL